MDLRPHEIKPKGDKVLIRHHPDDAKIGSIIVPDVAKTSTHCGTVLAVGPGRRVMRHRRPTSELEPPEVKVGDVVLFDDHRVMHTRYGEAFKDIVLCDGLDVLVALEPDEPRIPRCGDVVFNRHTGERWVVAYAYRPTGRLSWCGWPEGTAAIEDCELVWPCSDEEHRRAVQQWADSTRGGDHRRGYVLDLYGDVLADGGRQR